MDGGIVSGSHKRKINNTKGYKGYEVLEIYPRPRLEGTRSIKEIVDFTNNCTTLKGVILYLVFKLWLEKNKCQKLFSSSCAFCNKIHDSNIFFCTKQKEKRKEFLQMDLPMHALCCLWLYICFTRFFFFFFAHSLSNTLQRHFNRFYFKFITSVSILDFKREIFRWIMSLPRWEDFTEDFFTHCYLSEILSRGVITIGH